MTRPVLVTGARAPVALDIARAFRAAGIEVHLADCVRPFAAMGMRPRVPIHRFAPPAQEYQAFRRDMADLIQRLAISLVIPTCEEVFFLAAAANVDDWTDRLYAPPLAALRRLHSKFEFAQLAGTLGLNAPETYVFDGQIPLLRASEDMVFKPEFSRFATQTLIGPKAEQVRALRPSPEQRWVAQKRIVGDEVCGWAATHRGRVTAFVAYRPRWRHGRAAAFQMEAVDSPAVKRIAERVTEALGLTGQVAFDVIVDRHGRAFPVECNPRAVSGLHLFDAAPELARAIRSGDPLASPPAGRLRHLGPAMAFLGIPQAVATGRLGALLRDWRNGRDVVARGAPGALAGCLADAARFSATAIVRGLQPAAATTADIEWDGASIK